MSSGPLVTHMNINQYQRFSGSQQVSHDRRHSDPFSDGSPALGESPLPVVDSCLDLHSSPSFPYLTATQPAYTPYIPPPSLEKPTSAPADTTTFDMSDASHYRTPPRQYTPLAGTTLHLIPEAWPGVKPEHHRSHSWAAIPSRPSPPQHVTPPQQQFSSPVVGYATPVHRPMALRGGTDGYDAVAYATYPYPGPQECEVPRAVTRKRSPLERSQSPGQTGRKHICPVCDKRFSRPSSLQTHMSVHTGAKPFICPRHDCGRRFSVSSNLRRHEKTHASRAAFSSDSTPFNPSGVQYHPYAQPVLGTPFMTEPSLPLEWQSAPWSSGLAHYSISRPSTRHDQPTTPETPPVAALGGLEDDIEAAARCLPHVTNI